ncbi:Uncharacterised protein [Rothia kristinae]|nr:Uncharacterised protein [Rothia kristinae]
MRRSIIAQHPSTPSASAHSHLTAAPRGGSARVRGRARAALPLCAGLALAGLVVGPAQADQDAAAPAAQFAPSTPSKHMRQDGARVLSTVDLPGPLTDLRLGDSPLDAQLDCSSLTVQQGASSQGRLPEAWSTVQPSAVDCRDSGFVLGLPDVPEGQVLRITYSATHAPGATEALNRYEVSSREASGAYTATLALTAPDSVPGPSASPSPSATTPTAPQPTPSATATPSPSASATPSATPSPRATPSASSTPSATATPSGASTPSPSASTSAVPSAPVTPEAGGSSTPSASASTAAAPAPTSAGPGDRIPTLGEQAQPAAGTTAEQPTSSTASSGDRLASTGAAVTGWSILGVGLLALGGALLVLARRRRLNRRDA